jgi:hypothetical protein
MKHKVIKAQYPSSFKKDEYIEFLTSEYLKEYSKFLPEQIQVPIIKIVDCIENRINEFKSGKYQLSIINYIKNLTKIKDDETEEMSQWALITIDYIKKDEETVKRSIEELSGVKLPDNMEQYLEFVSKMTKKVIKDICLATEAKIPHTTRVEYRRSISEAENITDAKLKKHPRSFVAEQEEKRDKKVHFSQTTKFV